MCGMGRTAEGWETESEREGKDSRRMGETRPERERQSKDGGNATGTGETVDLAVVGSQAFR
jgi:hypothetical protein